MDRTLNFMLFYLFTSKKQGLNFVVVLKKDTFDFWVNT